MAIKRDGVRTMRAAILVVLLALPCSTAESADSLVVRWNRFAHTGNDFAKKVNSGEFDSRLAHKLSEEWRDIENSGEWPK